MIISQKFNKFDLIREKQRRSLKEFFKAYWHILEPATDLIWGRVLDVMIEHLEAVARDEIEKLIITIPPGFSKSLTISVFFPAWIWIDRPYERFLTASHAQNLSMRDSRKMRNLVLSPKFQESFGRDSDWPEPVVVSPSQATKTRFENTATGFRYATSVGAGATGDRAKIRILDDPTDSKQIYSDAYREASLLWITDVWSSRYSDSENQTEILVQQRQHSQDVVAKYLEIGGYELLTLPMEFDLPRKFTSLGDYDFRQEKGELLFPERFNTEIITQQKRLLGEYGYASQYQQEPSPVEGGIFKIQNFKFWEPNGIDLGPAMIELPSRELWEGEKIKLPRADWLDLTLSLDASFGSLKSGASEVAIHVWANVKKYSTFEETELEQIERNMYLPNYYLIDRDTRKMSFTDTIKAIENMLDQYPSTKIKLIEKKANGQAVIDTLETKVKGLVPISPTESKVARAMAVSWLFTGRNIILPHPKLHDWIQDLIILVSQFPANNLDDDVDATTQYLNFMENGPTTTIS